MKSYTDIEQSKNLAKTLPLESADMHWQYIEEDNGQLQWFCLPKDFSINQYDTIQAWSLAALFNVLSNGTDVIKEEADTENEKYMCTVGINDNILTTFADNPVDACYEMIVKLFKTK